MAQSRQKTELLVDPTVLEVIGQAGGFGAKIVALAALAAVVAGLLIMVGILGEQILRAFSISAGLKFESLLGSWIGRHFLDIVKVALWVVALGSMYATIKKSPPARRTGAFEEPPMKPGAKYKYLVIAAIGVIVVVLGIWGGITTRRCPLVIPLGLSVLLLVGRGLIKSRILPLAWRELSSWLLSPLGYVIAAGFAIMAGRMFVASMAELSELRSDNPLAIQPLASFLASNFFAVALLILVAVISMRLMAGERERGTSELLYSLPLTDGQIVLGKFMGAWAFFCLVMLVTLVHMSLYGAFGDLDYRQILSSYVGLGLIGMAFVGVGLFCSSLVHNQIVAGLLVFLVLGITIFLGDIVSFVGVGAAAGGWAEYTSLMPHLDWAARGTIDSRTFFAMGSTCALSLFLAFCALRASRQGIFWNVFESYNSTHWTRLLVGLALAVATLLFLQTHFAGRAVVKLAVLIWSAILMALAWGPICRGRLAGGFSFWRFVLVVAAGPVVVLVGILGTAYFADAVRPILAVLIAVVLAALVVPRLYGGQLRGRLLVMGNIMVALVCVLIINVTGNYLAIKHHQALDISSGQVFSLSPEAKRIFQEQVPDGERVDVYCIISSSSYAGQHDATRRNLLDRELRIFADSVNHPGNVKLAYRFLDPTEDSGEIGRLINRYDVNSNRQVLLVYRDQQYILDGRDLFELFPDRSRMTEFRANWQTMRERFGVQVPPPPKTDEDAFKLLEALLENAPTMAEQLESYLALRARGNFQQRMCQAILRLVQGKMQRICFTQGHGEARLTGGQRGPDSAHDLRRSLRQYNYIVTQVGPLIGERQIPRDACLLVILGPSERFAAEEVEKIDKYIAAGGRVLALINPGQDAGLGKLLGKYGIKALDNQAVAMNQYGHPDTIVGAPLRTAAGWTRNHPIIDGTLLGVRARGQQGGYVVAEGVRQVGKDPESEPDDYLVSDLLQVPPSYSASKDTSPAPKNPGTSPGPYPFAVIAEKIKKPADEQEVEAGPKNPSLADVDDQGGKLLVIGDSDMLTDKPIMQGRDLRGKALTAPLFMYPGSSNEDFAMIALGYLAGEIPEIEKIESKEHKVYISSQMKAAYQEARNRTGLILWLGIPGVLLLGGLAVWIARRSY